MTAQDVQALSAAEKYPLIQAGYCKNPARCGWEDPEKVVSFAVERGFICHSIEDVLPVPAVSPEEGNVAYLPVGTTTQRHMHMHMSTKAKR